MARGSAQLTESRKAEIIEACSKIYYEKSFKEIKLQDIANATTLTRTALYKYYQTKEEIFLALLQREYEEWNRALLSILEGHEELSKEKIAEELSLTLESRIQLLKLMSMNNFELEEQSRYENVVEYKEALGASMKLVRRIIDKFCKELDEDRKEKFIYAFFPFTFGIYPYTNLNSKATKAMEDAGVGFHYYSIYQISYNCIINLLNQ